MTADQATREVDREVARNIAQSRRARYGTLKIQRNKLEAKFAIHPSDAAIISELIAINDQMVDVLRSMQHAHVEAALLAEVRDA